MSKLSNAIISIFRKGEKRISSEQFEQAVNQVLLSDAVADATKKPIITPEGSLAISAVWVCVRVFSKAERAKKPCTDTKTGHSVPGRKVQFANIDVII